MKWWEKMLDRVPRRCNYCARWRASWFCIVCDECQNGN